MLYLISVGIKPSLAFKTMEAVRKGKVKKSGSFPDDAEEQMRALGVPEWYIESARKIAYLFPKAHAVAYVMMAFRIAWFKVHEPLAFYLAYFYRRSQKGGFDAAMMCKGMEECKASLEGIQKMENRTDKDDQLLTTLEVVYEFYLRGFRFGSVDLKKSHATRFTMEGDKLIPPFNAIAGLGESAAWDIYEKRDREFTAVEEFAMACSKVSKTHIDELKAAGAFGDMPDSAQISFF